MSNKWEPGTQGIFSGKHDQKPKVGEKKASTEDKDQRKLNEAERKKRARKQSKLSKMTKTAKNLKRRAKKKKKK